MKESVKSKIQQIKASGKGKKNVQVTLKSGNRDSLAEIIKTKEQADLFMKMLKAAQ